MKTRQDSLFSQEQLVNFGLDCRVLDEFPDVTGQEQAEKTKSKGSVIRKSLGYTRVMALENCAFLVEFQESETTVVLNFLRTPSGNHYDEG